MQAAVDETESLQRADRARLGQCGRSTTATTRRSRPTNANVAASDSDRHRHRRQSYRGHDVRRLSHYANVGFAVIVPTVTADSITARGYHNVFRLPAKDSDRRAPLCERRARRKKRVPALAVALRRQLRLRRRARIRATGQDRPSPGGHPALSEGHTGRSGRRGANVLDREPGYVFLSGKTAELGPIVEALRLARLHRRLRRERRLLQHGHD